MILRDAAFAVIVIEGIEDDENQPVVLTCSSGAAIVIGVSKKEETTCVHTRSSDAAIEIGVSKKEQPVYMFPRCYNRH